MMDAVHYLSNTVEWATPQALYDALHTEFRFTLDPCATHENRKCGRYFTKEIDGLMQDWSGERVFMNPPYGRGLTGKWIKKAYESTLTGGGHRGLSDPRAN